MPDTSYVTFLFAVSLNVALYVLLSKRCATKVDYLKQRVGSMAEKEDLLLRRIDDKDRLIESYEREVYLSDREKGYLKEEIVKLERDLGIQDPDEAIL